MVLVLATLRACHLFTHQMFFPLPDSSLQYSLSLESYFHKSKILLSLGMIGCLGAEPDAPGIPPPPPRRKNSKHPKTPNCCKEEN